MTDRTLCTAHKKNTNRVFDSQTAQCRHYGQWEKVEVMTTKKENLRTKMRKGRGLDLQERGRKQCSLYFKTIV